MSKAEIIARLEALKGPVLDGFERARLAKMVPDVVTDLDSEGLFNLALKGGLEAIGAAVALVERVLPGWRVHGLGRSPLHGLWWCQLYSLEKRLAAEVEEIDTAPIALLVAMLKAMEHAS